MTVSDKLLIENYNSYYRKSSFSTLLQGRGIRISKAYDLKFDNDFISKNILPEWCINCPNSYVSIIRENESMVSYLHEGLITTYPFHLLQKSFKSFCQKNLSKEQLEVKIDIGKGFMPAYEQYNLAEYDQKTQIAGLVTFYIPTINDNSNSLIGEISDLFHTFGYDLSEHSSIQAKDVNGNVIKLLKLTYEARFYRKDVNFTDWLFHVTEIKNVKKILKNGLVPKSSNRTYSYNDRVYLFNNSNIDEILTYARLKNRTSTVEKVIILRIKSDDLQKHRLYANGKLRFYVDPKYTTDLAIYTHNNIPVELIDNQCSILSIENGIIINSELVLLQALQ